MLGFKSKGNSESEAFTYLAEAHTKIIVEPWR
jgi:hypothetical protein